MKNKPTLLISMAVMGLSLAGLAGCKSVDSFSPDAKESSKSIWISAESSLEKKCVAAKELVMNGMRLETVKSILGKPTRAESYRTSIVMPPQRKSKAEYGMAYEFQDGTIRCYFNSESILLSIGAIENANQRSNPNEN